MIPNQYTILTLNRSKMSFVCNFQASKEKSLEFGWKTIFKEFTANQSESVEQTIHKTIIGAAMELHGSKYYQPRQSKASNEHNSRHNSFS